VRRATLTLLLAACAARPVPLADAGCADAGCATCCDMPGDAGPEPMGCAATCAGCCDDGGVCRAGRAQLACGEGGAACTACAAGTQCSAGACITVSQCDLACGAACCSGGSCTAAACGFDGGACATCGAGELCAAGACGPGFGTRWRLKVVSAVLAPARPNGMPWDDKNDPDSKVCANVGDAGQVCTLEASETFMPVWNMTFAGPYSVEQLGSVELSVIDSDFPGQTVIDELGTLDLRPRWSGATQAWVVNAASVTQLKLEVEPAP